MQRKQHKYHFIYKTTNLKNNKYYIGMHSTDNLNDKYIGSGKRLRNSIRAHGLECHHMEILEFFENRELLVIREEEIVNEELLNDPLCMNLMTGGQGGLPKFSTPEKQKEFHTLGAIAINKKNKENPEKFKKSMEGNSKKISKILKDMIRSGEFLPPFAGKKHTEDSKNRIGIKNSISSKGDKNSQFGTKWMYNIEKKENIKVLPEQMEKLLLEGWIPGRKMSF